MPVDQAVDLLRESMTLMLLMATPILVAALVVGLCISVFQAVTQIQEQTLSFVPKIFGMAIVAMLITPWLATIMGEFAIRMFSGAN